MPLNNHDLFRELERGFLEDSFRVSRDRLVAHFPPVDLWPAGSNRALMISPGHFRFFCENGESRDQRWPFPAAPLTEDELVVHLDNPAVFASAWRGVVVAREELPEAVATHSLEKHQLLQDVERLPRKGVRRNRALNGVWAYMAIQSARQGGMHDAIVHAANQIMAVVYGRVMSIGILCPSVRNDETVDIGGVRVPLEAARTFIAGAFQFAEERTDVFLLGSHDKWRFIKEYTERPQSGVGKFLESLSKPQSPRRKKKVMRRRKRKEPENLDLFANL